MNKEQIITNAYSEHATTIQRMCYMYLGDYHLAEDAVSETFLKAYKSMDTFRGLSNIKTWLVRIAINTGKNMLKKESTSDIPLLTTPKYHPTTLQMISQWITNMPN